MRSILTNLGQGHDKAAALGVIPLQLHRIGLHLSARLLSQVRLHQRCCALLQDGEPSN